MELTQGWHHPHKLRIIVLGRLVAGKVKTITHLVNNRLTFLSDFWKPNDIC